MCTAFLVLWFMFAMVILGSSLFTLVQMWVSLFRMLVVLNSFLGTAFVVNLVVIRLVSLWVCRLGVMVNYYMFVLMVSVRMSVMVRIVMKWGPCATLGADDDSDVSESSYSGAVCCIYCSV